MGMCAPSRESDVNAALPGERWNASPPSWTPITWRHRAGLSLGDVCSYALARTRGEPLLFKGDDFAGTDIGRVL